MTKRKPKFSDFIYDDNVQLFLLISLFIGLIVLGCVAYSHNKQDCIESGGKWIDGFVGGSYTAMCISK